MPELPDVEKMRTYLQHTVLHKRISNISVKEEQVLTDISPQQLGKELGKSSFLEAVRHGKHCFLTTDGKKSLACHFGMTGDVRYFKAEESSPPHICLLVNFENGYSLAYTSTRKLGEIEMCGTPESFIDDKELGLDALAADLDKEQFVATFSGRRGMLKSALMNQKLVAGIGNVYSDEILFQERLHPKTTVRSLDDERLGRIFTTMRTILEKAVAAEGQPEKIPNSFLTSHRNGDGKCPNCKNPVEKLAVAGRNGCYCPVCQKK